LRAAIAAQLPGGQAVRIVEAERNLGFAGGVNLCMAQTPGADAWWVLNPDTQPEPPALGAMVKRLSQGDCEAVGCTLYLPNDSIQSHGGRWRPWLARSESIGLGRAKSEPIDQAQIERSQNYLNGASMLISRRFLEEVGPMREEYFLYCEEVEWCLRALARGLRLGFAAEARVLHAQGATTGAGRPVKDRPRMPVYLGERNKLLVTRDCFPARFAVAAIASLMLLGLRCGPRGAWRHFRYGLAGWWAGVRGERGVPDWVLN
jgi:GT2 family glycosyltransferase